MIENEQEEMGKNIIQYLEKYKGKKVYNDIAKAIEFGYQLCQDKEMY